MREEQIAPGTECGRQRRLNRTSLVRPGKLGHGAVDVTVKTLRSCDHLAGDRVVHAKVPLREMAHEMYQRGNRQLARFGARTGAAHAVGHDHRVAVLVETRGHGLVSNIRQQRFLITPEPEDQVVVFVDRSQPPLAGMSAKGGLDRSR
jgi:hypothetical protein